MMKRTVEIAHPDQLNRAGRRYPLSILKKQVGRKPVQGEYGHPDFTRMHPEEALRRCQIVAAERVSHQASNFRLEDGVFVCDVEPAGPYGGLIEKNPDAFDFAMRGLCGFEGDGITVCQFELITVDAIYRHP